MPLFGALIGGGGGDRMERMTFQLQREAGAWRIESPLDVYRLRG